MDKRMTYGGNGSHWDGCAEAHWDCKIAQLEAELAALREQVRWIPVNEKRPTRGDCATDPLGRPISYVLGCVNGHLYGLIHLDYFDINTTYTHWMPLPKPPEGE